MLSTFFSRYNLTRLSHPSSPPLLSPNQLLCLRITWVCPSLLLQTLPPIHTGSTPITPCNTPSTYRACPSTCSILTYYLVQSRPSLAYIPSHTHTQILTNRLIYFTMKPCFIFRWTTSEGGVPPLSYVPCPKCAQCNCTAVRTSHQVKSVLQYRKLQLGRRILHQLGSQPWSYTLGLAQSMTFTGLV